MTLLALGINHETASIDIREKLAFAPDEAARALKQVREAALVSEMAILSTCNRTELYCYCSTQASSDTMLDWLAAAKNIDRDALQAASYVHVEGEAARHMMTVASGLDSLVLGEPQILGQMKSCYAQADQHDSVSRISSFLRLRLSYL